MTITDEKHYTLFKDKLPKGYSYPLKRSVLDKHLAEAGLLEAVARVSYSYNTTRSNIPLGASFNGLNDLISPDTIWITIRAVPSKTKYEIEKKLISEALPKTIQWILKIMSASQTTKFQDYDLSCIIGEDKISYSNKKLKDIPKITIK